MNKLMRFALAVSMLLVSLAAMSQNVATANLSGVVKDPTGAVVAGATVTAHDSARNIDRAVKTAADGSYTLSLLPPGTYTISVTAAGFTRWAAKDVRLTVGQDAQLPVALKLASAEAEVTVNAQAELVETQRSAAGTTITQQRIDNLPTNGRNYINFTLTNSQVARDTAPSIGAAPTSGLNIGGQRARSNLVNVDGADAEDNSVNGIRSTVSQEAVQEFQLITNGYAAEYGRASGGVVNIVTKGGENNMHATAFGFLRQRSLEAKPHFSNVSDPAYTRVQAGFTLSGPIKKDRTFYFLSYETTRRQETGFSTIGANNFDLVPLPNAAFYGLPANALVTAPQAAALGGVPDFAKTVYARLAAAGSGTALTGTGGFATSGSPLPASYVGLLSLTGNYPVSEGTSIYSLRLDHKLNDHNNLMLRGSVSPSTVTGIQVNAQNQNFGQNAFSRTSDQTYRDLNTLLQETWVVSDNKINEFRYQYARRGLRYDFSKGPGGSNVAINIPGFAFFGREPFSWVDRVEQRHELNDNFTWLKGTHQFKFGVDYNELPLDAQFTVNFGGLFNFGELNAGSLAFGVCGAPGSAPFPNCFPTGADRAEFAGMPNFSPVQAYGLGIPQVFVQGVGNPNLNFSNHILGSYAQDSWRIKPNLTLNYGVRYDVEFTSTFAANTPLSAAAEQKLGITEGIPQDLNNVAPRIGIAWDPFKDGKTAVRASYGLFFDHPLLALAFDSAVADGTQAPQLAFFGGAPCNAGSSASPLNLNATNIFQGILGNANCFPNPAAGYLPNEQRFDAFFPNSLFVNQNYLNPTTFNPLIVQPFGFPVSRNFQYAYSDQANLQIERELGKDFSISVGYNFNGGHHLNRPINANPVNSEALIENWERAVAAGAASPSSNPLTLATCGAGPAGPFVPSALVSFFRPSGTNPSLAPVFAPCAGAAAAVSAQYGLGQLGTVPFSDMIANYANGSSVYHGLTTNVKKRFSSHYEMLASYTWSHAIDDSTDLQSLLAPQDSRRPDLERSNSSFDQRHRFVISGVYQSGKVLANHGGWSALLSNWTIAPIVEASSGRPFNILTGSDRNFDLGSNTDRPLAVPAGSATNLCGDPVVASKFSPTGFFQAPCYIDGTFDGKFTGQLTGNLGRNAGVRPMTVFTDFRVGRRVDVTERLKLDATMDIFNLINKFNVADVNPLYTQAGMPSAAFDPRQFQFGLKLSW